MNFFKFVSFYFVYTLIKEINMSEELNTIHEEKCFCKSEFFKRFASVALGTFVGGFCAISLFASLNKPPMMPMMPMMHHSIHSHHMMMHHKHNCKCPYHKDVMKKHFEKRAEFHKKMLEKKKLENKD